MEGVTLTEAEAGLVVSALYALVEANQYISRYRHNAAGEIRDAEALIARIVANYRRDA